MEIQEESIKMKIQELEEQLKDKEDYINFLITKTTIDEITINPKKLKPILQELLNIKQIGIDIKNAMEKNSTAMNNVWPHLMNVMMNQCMLRNIYR